MRNQADRFIAILLVLLCWATIIEAQSGGTFTITKSVVAGGGGTASGGTFVATGTIAQPVSGTSSTGGTFVLSGGFWGGSVAPATSVTVSGKVFTSDGSGLKNAVVTLMNSQGVSTRVITTTFGNYTFNNVATNDSYLVTVVSKRFRFAQKNLFVTDNVSNFDFIGLE